MKRHLVWVAAAVLLVGAEGKDDAAKKDRERLQGYWNVVSAEHDGARRASARVRGSKIIFTGTKLALDQGNREVYEAKYTLHPDAKPCAIDINFLMGPLEGKPLQGIYELNGDELKICWSPSGQKRPKDFTAKAKSGRTLYRLKRGKP